MTENQTAEEIGCGSGRDHETKTVDMDALTPARGRFRATRRARGLLHRKRAGAAGTSLLFSPLGEAKCVRGPSVRGARRLARGGVVRQYGEPGKQGQQPSGGLMACFGRQVARDAG